MCGWGEAKPEMEPQRQSREWASIMDDDQPLTFDHPWSDFMLDPAGAGTAGGCHGGAHAGLGAAGPLSWWGGRAILPYCM